MAMATLHLLVPQVVRMRVVDVGERVQVDLEHLVAPRAFIVCSCCAYRCVSVAHDLLRRLSAELLLQVLRSELLPPELLGRRQVAWPLRVLAIERVDVVPVKSNFAVRSVSAT
jgi:hypothetical protein